MGITDLLDYQKHNDKNRDLGEQSKRIVRDSGLIISSIADDIDILLEKRMQDLTVQVLQAMEVLLSRSYSSCSNRMCINAQMWRQLGQKSLPSTEHIRLAVSVDRRSENHD